VHLKRKQGGGEIYASGKKEARKGWWEGLKKRKE
jgi:hypothetical protein